MSKHICDGIEPAESPAPGSTLAAMAIVSFIKQEGEHQARNVVAGEGGNAKIDPADVNAAPASGGYTWLSRHWR